MGWDPKGATQMGAWYLNHSVHVVIVVWIDLIADQC